MSLENRSRVASIVKVVNSADKTSCLVIDFFVFTVSIIKAPKVKDYLIVYYKIVEKATKKSVAKKFFTGKFLRL